MIGGGERIRARLPDHPDSPARARELLLDLDGAGPDRADDARLLLHELVAAALFEGVECVEVRVSAQSSCLRLEVVSEARPVKRLERRLTPAAQLGHQLIEELSDRSGGDATTLWCELDGAWSLRGDGGVLQPDGQSGLSRLPQQ